MKRKVVYYTDHELTHTERKKFKKENPGKKLCFRLRYPNFLIYQLAVLSFASLVISITALIMRLLR